MLIVSVSLYAFIWIVTTSHTSIHQQQDASSKGKTRISALKEDFITKRNNAFQQKRRQRQQQQPQPPRQSDNDPVLQQKQKQTILQTQPKQVQELRPSSTTTTTTIPHPTTNPKDKLFVNYQLLYDQPYNVTFGPFTRCTLGVVYNKRGKKPIERTPLSKELHGIIDKDFTVTIQTNMKIISVGDSVLMQFHEVLEESVGMLWNDTFVGKRHVYHNAWGEHESVSVSAPVNGGGVLAAFRMTGLLLQSGKGRKPPNEGPAPNGAGGWKPEHVQELLTHQYNLSTGDTTTTTTTTTVTSFDTMIFRIPHGWLSLDVITKENLQEAILLGHELFGVRTVIIHSLFFNVSAEQKGKWLVLVVVLLEVPV
jgi:hypothetical protein